MQSKNSKISIKVERELQTFYFLEHPGFGSDKGLLSSLEGNILEAFKQRQQLKLKTKNSFVESHYEASANCLLKITKAKDQITYTIIGVVVKTIKFRDLFDFSVKLRTDDPLHNLATIMKETDVHRMFKYRYEPSKDNILVPPPSMCRLPFSLDYNMFKENTFIPADGNNADGTTERRVGQRRKIRNEFGAILLDGNAEDIPNRPPEKIPNLDEESNIATKNRAYKNIKEILEVITKLFQDRPIWTRHALANETAPKFGSYNKNLFKALSFIAYGFTNGPWKACWIKYGLDPRKDPQYRHYQTIDLRGIFAKQKNIIQNISKVPISAGKINQLGGDSKLIANEFKNHMIDGIHYTASRQFQLCDIVDSNYQQLIYSVVYLADQHTVKDGWYVEGHIAAIRKRLKEEMKDLRSRAYQNEENQDSDLDDQDEEEGGDKLNMTMMDYMDALGDDDEFDILEEDY